MKLVDKAALVTGAGSGIGKAIAINFAQAGAKVGVLDLDADEVKQVANDITAQGGASLELIADVAQPEQMQNAVQSLVDKWGRLDIVVANAGINGVWAPIVDLTPEEWDKTLDINLKGTFLTIKYAIPHLCVQRGGSIVITSSINGSRVFSSTGATAYSCSKAGQVAFAKMAAVELGQDGIRVNVICPGTIATDIGESTVQRDLDAIKMPAEYPAGSSPLTGEEPGQPEQVADLALFLASDASSHINGTEIWIDGGQSLIRG